MRPAYLLDAALDFFSTEVKKGAFEDRGIPPEVNNEDHLNAIRYHFRASILDPLKIYELFTCDTNKYVAEFLSLVSLMFIRINLFMDVICFLPSTSSAFGVNYKEIIINIISN